MPAAGGSDGPANAGVSYGTRLPGRPRLGPASGRSVGQQRSGLDEVGRRESLGQRGVEDADGRDALGMLGIRDDMTQGGSWPHSLQSHR